MVQLNPWTLDLESIPLLECLRFWTLLTYVELEKIWGHFFCLDNAVLGFYFIFFILEKAR